MKLLFTLIGLLLLNSCTFLLNSVTDEKYDVINIGDKKKLKIMFSHNINGETHPCGCRQNPLGGLPQVAGAIHEASKDAEILYVDTGDTFFASANFPKTVANSLNHTAESLLQGLKMLNLKYFVPGDQDFADDMVFLNRINSNEEVTFLISNVKEKANFKHKKFGVVKNGPHEIYFMGIVDPKVISLPQGAALFNNPIDSIKATFKEVEKAGYKKENPFHRLILLSHAGLDSDEAIASAFPYFDWIIGAHSQSFTRFPVKVGETKPVQVLSRNHYLGQITIDLTKDKKEDKFEILEMRDEQKDKLNPNPLLAFIDSHKEKLAIIQKEEQDALLDKSEVSLKNFKMPTSSSCIECHADQGEFWQGTSHAIAYATLMNAKEEKNLSCVQCHSWGLNHENGFKAQDNIVHFHPDAYKIENVDNILKEGSLDEREKKRQQKLIALKQTYWSEVGNIFKDVKSIRKLDIDKRRQLAGKWTILDEKHQVSHNYANVQCLNCHDQHVDHPFTNLPEKTAEQKYKSMKAKCLSCHVSDQSPEWYDEGGKVKEVVLVEQMKKVGCPAQTE